MNAYIRSELLSPEECDVVISALHASHAQVGAVHTSATTAKERRQVRKSRVVFTHLPAALRDRVKEALHRANSLLFHFDIEGQEPAQIAEYIDGGHYDWHLDIGPGRATFRKLSASVQLSAPESYDGGQLELWGTPSVERSRGSLVVFPSYLLHRVTPVTRGVRYSLVTWATGEKSFR